MAAIQEIEGIHRRIDREIQLINTHTEARLKETRESIDREIDLKLANIKLEIRNTVNGLFWKLLSGIGGIVALIMIIKEILVFLFKGAAGLGP